jgi:hypothetical protein
MKNNIRLLVVPATILTILAVLSACANQSAENGINTRQSGTEPMKTQLLGGDRDEHDCIGSAGYSWCEAKQKCLRAWEEACRQGDAAFIDGNPVTRTTETQTQMTAPTTGSTEPATSSTEPTTIPATPAANPEEAGIKAAFAKKYDKPVSEITLNNPQITSNFARGGVTLGNGSGEGGMFLAVKKDNEWILAFDGNGAANCNEMETYGFPSAMLEGICY